MEGLTPLVEYKSGGVSVDDWRAVSDTPRQFRGGFAAPGSFQCFTKHQNRIHGKSLCLPLLATSHIAISDVGAL